VPPDTLAYRIVIVVTNSGNLGNDPVVHSCTAPMHVIVELLLTGMQHRLNELREAIWH
jgi:hypothetical protein